MGLTPGFVAERLKTCERCDRREPTKHANIALHRCKECGCPVIARMAFRGCPLRKW